MTRWAWLLVVPGLLALSGCSTSVVRRSLERRVERKLTEVLGPAERYRVRIRGSRDPSILRGRAKRVEVEGRGIRAQGEFLIDSLRLTVEDLRYREGEPVVIETGRTNLEVEFTDDALNHYLAVYHPRHQPVVRFESDRVHVRMVYTVLGKETPILASGGLSIRHDTQLVFDADTVDLTLLDAPGFGEKFVEDRVNPLLDLGKIDFPARLVTVQVLDGRIRAHGSANIRRALDR